jgi:hypothetical protein
MGPRACLRARRRGTTLGHSCPWVAWDAGNSSVGDDDEVRLMPPAVTADEWNRLDEEVKASAAATSMRPNTQHVILPSSGAVIELRNGRPRVLHVRDKSYRVEMLDSYAYAMARIASMPDHRQHIDEYRQWEATRRQQQTTAAPAADRKRP